MAGTSQPPPLAGPGPADQRQVAGSGSAGSTGADTGDPRDQDSSPSTAQVQAAGAPVAYVATECFV